MKATLIGSKNQQDGNILIISDDTLKKKSCDLNLPCIKSSLYSCIGEVSSVKIDGFSFNFEAVKSVDDTKFNDEVIKISSAPNIVGVFLPKSSEELFVKQEGKIHITVAMDLQPFFDDEFQKNFQVLRNSKEWANLIGFTEEANSLKKIIEEKSKRESKSQYAEYDMKERELEKIGYDMEVFRGSLYSDFFTPIYKINKEGLNKKLEDKKTEYTQNKIYMANFLEKLKNLSENWGIKIRFSRSGLVCIFIEKEVKKVKEEDVKLIDYIEETLEILKDPYLEEMESTKKEIETIKESIKELISDPRLTSLLTSFHDEPSEILKWMEDNKKYIEALIEKDDYTKIYTKVGNLSDKDKRLKDIYEELKEIRIRAGKEQIFDLWLWMLSVCAVYFFLEEYFLKEYKEEIKNSLKLKKPLKEIKNLDEISYTKGMHYENQALVRNFFVVFHLPADIEGLVINELDKPIKLNLKDHLACPVRKDTCPKSRTNKACFIWEFGKQIYSLSEFAFKIKDATTEIIWPEVSLEKIDKLSTEDLSSWEGEICLLNGMFGVICYQDFDVQKIGAVSKYRDYWRCIIKGLGFLVLVKTGCQVIERELYDASYRMRQIEEGKNKEIDKLRKGIIVLGNIINERLRIAANPFSISRADYAIVKFRRFIELLGIDNILKSIEASFEEVNRGITHYYEAKRAKTLTWLTFLLVPLTLIIAIGTIILVIIEI